MAFTTGTATHQNDLLDKLRLWLTGTAGWTQLAWTAGATVNDQSTLSIRGPGAGANRETFVNVQSRINQGAGAFGWAIRGAVAYDSGQPWASQPETSEEVFLNLWNQSTPYWFYANDRRFIVVAKVSTAYLSCYAGMFLPFALPTEYPFPLYIGASYPTLAPYSQANARNRFIADPGDGAAYYKPRGSSGWKKMRNHVDSGSAYAVSGGTDPVIWPHRVPRASGSSSNDEWNIDGLLDLRPNVQGELPQWQCHIIDPQSAIVPGMLDGVFAAPGFGRSSEQTITAGGRTWRLFQNVFRSTGRDFMAIEVI